MLAEAGIIRPYSPVTLARLVRTVQQWGLGPAGAFLAASVVGGDKVWLVDELGELTFNEVDRRTNALARALRAHGVESGSSVAIMARNHRGFVDATVAAAKLGADVLFLNTAFSGPQLADVAQREKPRALIYDHEFGELIRAAMEVRDSGTFDFAARATPYAKLNQLFDDFERRQQHDR